MKQIRIELDTKRSITVYNDEDGEGIVISQDWEDRPGGANVILPFNFFFRDDFREFVTTRGLPDVRAYNHEPVQHKFNREDR
ncbi:MAG: hypothetical protein GY906_36920 [bacterium]|nr:hypothetical protein [bacterium]